LILYRTLHQFISKEVAGVGELLDIGNGGVFDYDTSGVRIDYSNRLIFGRLATRCGRQVFSAKLSADPGQRPGAAERHGKFDMVLMVMLIHHLTSTDWRSSWENARLALDESLAGVEARRSTSDRRILRSLVVFSIRKARALAIIPLY